MNDEQKVILTKAQLLKGVEYSEEVYFERLGGSVKLRPLTDGEFTEAQRLAQAGMKGPVGGVVEVDVEAHTARVAASNAFVAACGLSVGKEKWTVAEVKALSPPGIVKEIAEAVLRQTRVDEAALANFRLLTGRGSRSDYDKAGISYPGDRKDDADAAKADPNGGEKTGE